MPEILTPKEAGEYLQVPEGTLRQWRYLAQGPPYCRAGRAIRYRRADVDRWLEAQRVDAR